METNLEITKNTRNLKNIKSVDNYYYGRGKLLISGEYFVLEGAEALAIPVSVGQSINIRYSPSFNPHLYWKSFDSNEELWFETKFEFWHFDCLDENPDECVYFLQKILRQARQQNSHFLRDEVDVFVEARLEFPLDWGLGSSSTLIYNIAQWAYVSPFELLFNVYGGSGYDIACAQADHPIIYKKTSKGPGWIKSDFDPIFQDSLYFVHMGRKVSSLKALDFYYQNKVENKEVVKEISQITRSMEVSTSLEEFEKLIQRHEDLVSTTLGLSKVKERSFDDYWGEVKSLGAWGGDFVLVTSNRSQEETKQYFYQKGHQVFIPYSELVLSNKLISENPFSSLSNYLH